MARRLTVANTANVADNPIVLTGILNPATDSGLSTGTTNVTNVKQPDFFGNSEPFSHVTLFATTLARRRSRSRSARSQAGSDGSWNIESRIALADGHYAITATAIDQFGVTTTTAPTVITSDLLIDTHGPVITGMFFNRLNGQVDYTIQDPGATPSGVWVNSLLDSSNYQLTKVHAEKNFPGKYFVTNVTATPDPAIANAYDVAVTFNAGRPSRAVLPLQIRDSCNGDASVQDLAENHLDGEFYGSFPSGNHINGGDFIAELRRTTTRCSRLRPSLERPTRPMAAWAARASAAVHSGNFKPIVSRGGGSVFGSDPKHFPGIQHRAAKKHKPAVKIVKRTTKANAVSKPIGHANAKASLYDQAIMALVDSTTTKKKK